MFQIMTYAIVVLKNITIVLKNILYDLKYLF